MLGFFKWLFSFHDRHYRDGYNYSKNAMGRVSAIITEIVFIGIALGLEYWAMTLWGGDNFVGALLVTLLVFGVYITAIEYCLVYVVFGFMCAITGTLEVFLGKASDKVKERRAKKQAKLDAQSTAVNAPVTNEGDLENMVFADSAEADARKAEARETELAERHRAKKLRWLDLFVAVLSIALVIGTLVGGFLILDYAVQGKI